MNSPAATFLPDRAWLRELVRPWKLLSFGIAMTLLLYGALNYHIADWDVGVTLLMGSLTYLLAPWSVYTLINAIRHQPRLWPLQILGALLAALLVVDWAYMLYHHLAGNQVYREANFLVSMPLYFLAGTVWLYRGSLKDAWANISHLWHRPE